jgi:hypothetical protein
MRNLILAALVLSPTMLFAAGGAGSRTTSPVRVSTGVTAPKLISTVDIPTEAGSVWSVANIDRHVVVSMVVDETGKPQDLKIVESADPIEDKNVLTAVAQYRFQPGQLSHQPTAVPVNLEIILRNPAR